MPPKNIIDNHSRLSRDLRKHTRNGYLGKVPGGFEPGTPRSPPVEPMENLWYLCNDLLMYTVASPDPDPNPRGGGQLPNPKPCNSMPMSATRGETLTPNPKSAILR